MTLKLALQLVTHGHPYPGLLWQASWPGLGGKELVCFLVIINSSCKHSSIKSFRSFHDNPCYFCFIMNFGWNSAWKWNLHRGITLHLPGWQKGELIARSVGTRGRAGSLGHCWRERKMEQPLWRAERHYRARSPMHFTLDPSKSSNVLHILKMTCVCG